MVGLDTDTLYLLSRQARGLGPEQTSAPLYPAIPQLIESGHLPAAEAAALDAFYRLMERLRRQEDRMPLGYLLEQILVETQYDAKLLVRRNGRRRLANVRKLVQMAGAASAYGVGDFIRQLREIEKISEREGDAPTEEEHADVVRIMTVHRAKGLEFPVVFLGDMGRNTAWGDTALFQCDPETLALGCKLGDYSSAAYRTISDARHRRESEEANRLLYVALTRAREHLVLCGPTHARSRDAWSSVVFGHMGITLPQGAGETRIGPGGIAMTVSSMSAFGPMPPH
jgi:ATP-dependent helicase/nuclease subunit A